MAPLFRLILAAVLVLLTVVPGAAQNVAARGEPPVEPAEGPPLSDHFAQVRAYVVAEKDGGVHVFGDVVNPTDSWVSITAMIQYSNGCGQMTGDQGYGGLIPPRGTGIFSFRDPNFACDGQPFIVSAKAHGTPVAPPFAGLGMTPAPDPGAVLEYSGFVTNPHPWPVRILSATAGYYDAAGKMLYAERFSFGLDRYLQPGQGEWVGAPMPSDPRVARGEILIEAVRPQEHGGGILLTYDLYYADAFPSIFRWDIAWIAERGITRGCADHRYCPNQAVTRGQMAAFLVRAFDLPSTSTDFFADDDSSIFEADINRLAAAGIAGGCRANAFCPDRTLQRGEMAAFLVRAFGLPSTSTDFFADDDSSIFEADINRLAAAGIAGGCRANAFCPAGSTTRGQMAAFLHRAID